MEFFFVKILRDINNSRRDIKLVMERKARIEGKNESIWRLRVNQMFHFLGRMISSI